MLPYRALPSSHSLTPEAICHIKFTYKAMLFKHRFLYTSFSSDFT